MTRLPDIKKLSVEVNSTKIKRKQYVRNSSDFLVAHAADLAAYHDIYHLAEVAYDGAKPDKQAQSIAYHLEQIRSELARQLWARQIFVSVSVIDELLFTHTKSGANDPVFETLNSLRASEVSRRGLVVFPLHSFGILAAGLLRPLSGSGAIIINPEQRFAISQQTNELKRTTDHINKIAPLLGVKKSVDGALIQHWRDSRDARWLEHNPLLVAGVSSTSGFYYENEFLLLGRLQALTAAVSMLATLQPRVADRSGYFFSSSTINNWETLDLRHYLVLTHTKASTLEGQAVPVHKRRQILELSELAVEIDPRYWTRRAVLAESIYSSVEALFAGYLRYSVGSRKDTARSRVYRKLFESIHYFRRSHQGAEEDWTAVVSLATAFEMLLTDFYAKGIAKQLRHRTKLLLRGTPGTRRYQSAVEEIYNARNRAVHSGQVEQIDLHEARVAYVHVFVALMQRLPTLRNSEENPVAFLTGDL